MKLKEKIDAYWDWRDQKPHSDLSTVTGEVQTWGGQELEQS